MATLEGVIKEWIEVEKYTEKEFGRLAEKAETLVARNTFQFLSDAGRRHAEMLNNILTLTSDGEKALPLQTFSPVIPKVGERTYRTSVEELYYGAEQHLTLEIVLAEAYEHLSGIFKSKEATHLLHSLAEEERVHHGQLKALIRVFEEVFPFLKKSPV